MASVFFFFTPPCFLQAGPLYLDPPPHLWRSFIFQSLVSSSPLLDKLLMMPRPQLLPPLCTSSVSCIHFYYLTLSLGLCSSPIRFWGLAYVSLPSTWHRARCAGAGVNKCTRGLPKSRKLLQCVSGAPSVRAYMSETLQTRETPGWWVRTHDDLITVRMIKRLWNYVYK